MRVSGRAGRPLKARSREQILVGIDTGGTFTDVVARVGGRLRLAKTPSTPADPAIAVLRGLSEVLGRKVADGVTYSTTVAINALLERKGARVLLVTNAGFEDLIEIGRQNRPALYELSPVRPVPLVPAGRRLGVRERTLVDGAIARPLTRAELARLRCRVARARPDSIAVCLLHSYANPGSEEAIGRALAPLRLPVSLSHRLLAEYREYERLSTAVVNAYVAPRMTRHLGRLAQEVKANRLRVLQSSGTAVTVEVAAREPARTILSGPAAGVVGASRLARTFGVDRFVTFDMGGTSTDVSLFDGQPTLRAASEPAGHPVRMPVIDIHTVGAGGGSLARVDAGGSLKVGPESAGADPGPACYGRGEQATVTDADVVAGRLLPASFLGGRMALDPERAAAAVAVVARDMRAPLGAAALGILRVVGASMERAVRVISVERGFDPRDLALLAFGGAGPMHACDLAAGLGIRHVILPRHPGLLCAYGALAAPDGRELSQTVRLADPSVRALEACSRPLAARARQELAAQGVRRASIRCEVSIDLRYSGEAYEIPVPLTPSFRDAFHTAHRRLFGHASTEKPLEAVNLRARAVSEEPLPSPARRRRRRSQAVPLGRAHVLLDRGPRDVDVYGRADLAPGVRLRGPIVLSELSSTAWVAPGFTLRADDYGNLHLETR